MSASPTSMQNILIEKILDLLPQTQCTHCGYISCRSYAQAIATQKANINRCATGGQQGIHRLATLLGIEEPLLDTTYGEEAPRFSAQINESACIGCTICIRVCPTDAIIGTSKMMHTILQQFCTGCGQCVPRCPLDAISMKNISGNETGWNAWSYEQALNARHRYEAKLMRLHTTPKTTLPLAHEQLPATSAKAKSISIKKAIERARARLKAFGIKTN